MNPSEGVREIEKEARQIAKDTYIHNSGSSLNPQVVKMCRISLEQRIAEALTQAEKRGFEMARDEAAKVSEDFGDIALLISQTQKHLGSQGTQKGIAIAGERIAKEIRNLTYEKKEAKNAKTN